MSLSRRRSRLSDDEVAEILDGPPATTRAGARLQSTARLLTPAVAPSETFYNDLWDRMVWEFTRPESGPAMERPSETPAPTVPVAYIVDDCRIDMADVDDVSPDDAAEAARRLLEIANLARHGRQ